MPEIKFRWPEEQNQHVNAAFQNEQNRYNEDYVDKWPAFQPLFGFNRK
ncbi:MAG: hypothetical protein FWC71_05805 [Defluviitaleaceae bacterium]|nr:hypothetical protein [Defluviitaleaceae bacterium]